NGRRPIDALTHGPRLLFLGRIEPRNGLGTALAALPRILARHPNAVLTVAGDGPWRGYYERRARALGDSVRFVGQVFEERPAHHAARAGGVRARARHPAERATLRPRWAELRDRLPELLTGVSWRRGSSRGPGTESFPRDARESQRRTGDPPRWTRARS